MKDYIKPIAEIVRFHTEAITDDTLLDAEYGVTSGGEDNWD